MIMNLLKKIREISNIKNYSLKKRLDDFGVEVSVTGLDGYDKPTAKSMRLDILCGLRRVTGYNWAQFGALLDEEFAAIIEAKKRKKN